MTGEAMAVQGVGGSFIIDHDGHVSAAPDVSGRNDVYLRREGEYGKRDSQRQSNLNQLEEALGSRTPAVHLVSCSVDTLALHNVNMSSSETTKIVHRLFLPSSPDDDEEEEDGEHAHSIRLSTVQVTLGSSEVLLDARAISGSQ